METESRMVVARGWGQGMGSEFQFCKVNRVLDIGGDDGCTTLWMSSTLLSCAIQTAQMIKCYVYFTTIKN